MHPLLERQLKKIFNNKLQFSPEWQDFFKIVSYTYGNYDEDRKFLERSFDISSKEFLELHDKVLKLLEELKTEKEGVEQKVIERTQELERIAKELNQSNRLLTKREKELTIANEHLLELDKVKTEFISVAAHQIRTPLTGIRWALKEIIDEKYGKITEEQAYLLKQAHQNSARLVKLVGSLLNVAEIEEGKYLYRPAPVQIESVVQSVIDSLQEKIKISKIEFKFIKPEKDLPKVAMDMEKMQIAIQNLLDNSIKYTLPHGKVIVSLKQENEKVVFSIQDTGIGIPKDQQEKIFTKFFREAGAIKMETEGSGLGLVIVKNIIEAHGGKIWFESEGGSGTTFYFQLPVFVASP
ncbi:HAMP domain-containing histidine kinase [Candidatus Kaiserbacteria bacterium]|nr:HAMP domain-containing histidine kinase [Candidatus Kaiserbacteria bacterium]